MSAKELEQYYSTDHVLDVMVNALNHVGKCDIWIDPSAGNGEFFRRALSNADQTNVLQFDIRPKDPSGKVQRGDFASEAVQMRIQNKLDSFKHIYKRQPIVCVASNPPFKQISEWMKLVEPWADYVLFLAPKQLHRFAYQLDTIPPSYQLRWQQPLDNSTFVFRRKAKSLRTVAQVWQKSPPLIVPFPKTVEQLGITDWRFGHVSEFHSVSDTQRVCYCRKTFKTWKVSDYDPIGERFLIVKTPNGQLPRVLGLSKKAMDNPKATHRWVPKSTYDLIFCVDETVQLQLLKLGALVQAYQPPIGCTRQSFRDEEFAWFWVKYFNSQRWAELNMESAICKSLQVYTDDLNITSLDEFLFKPNQ